MGKEDRRQASRTAAPHLTALGPLCLPRRSGVSTPRRAEIRLRILPSKFLRKKRQGIEDIERKPLTRRCKGCCSKTVSSLVSGTDTRLGDASTIPQACPSTVSSDLDLLVLVPKASLWSRERCRPPARAGSSHWITPGPGLPKASCKLGYF